MNFAKNLCHMSTAEAFKWMAPGARKRIIQALYLGAEWESTVMDSYGHMKKDPEYKRAMRARAKFLKLRVRLMKAHCACLL